jgi:hypothetical protein
MYELHHWFAVGINASMSETCPDHNRTHALCAAYGTVWLTGVAGPSCTASRASGRLRATVLACAWPEGGAVGGGGGNGLRQDRQGGAGSLTPESVYW